MLYGGFFNRAVDILDHKDYYAYVIKHYENKQPIYELVVSDTILKLTEVRLYHFVLTYLKLPWYLSTKKWHDGFDIKPLSAYYAYPLKPSTKCPLFDYIRTYEKINSQFSYNQLLHFNNIFVLNSIPKYPHQEVQWSLKDKLTNISKQTMSDIYETIYYNATNDSL